MTHEQAIDRAQKTANEAQCAVAILNLNRFMPLYVFRYWNDDYWKSPNLVAKINPNRKPQMADEYREKLDGSDLQEI